MNNIAYNVMTGLFFVTGKGFVAKTPTEATPLNELDTMDMAEKWLDVKFITTLEAEGVVAATNELADESCSGEYTDESVEA